MELRTSARRAGRRTRKDWRDARVAVLKQHWKLLTGALAATMIGGGIGLWLESTTGHPVLGGILLGTVMTGFLGSVYWVVDLMSGAHNAKFGTLGETNTTGLFRTRSMRRKGWKIVDSIPFDKRFGDVDHVACGPDGVLAIETKWTNVDWKIVDGKLVTPGDPLKQALAGAGKIRHVLKSHNITTSVLPVLVVWGPGSLPLDFVAQTMENVVVVNGPSAHSFMNDIASFTRSPASPAEVNEMVQALLDRISTADAYAARAA